MNILLSEIAPSLEIRLILDCFSIDFSCLIKRKKPIADTINNKRSINSPLVGSFAKAWTETKTPDLTRKVPSKLNKNVIIDKKIVQFCK